MGEVSDSFLVFAKLYNFWVQLDLSFNSAIPERFCHKEPQDKSWFEYKYGLMQKRSQST